MGTAPFEAANLQKHGNAVFLINYPVDSTTEPAFSKEPEAVRNATLFAQRHAAEYNATASRTFLVGGSAGGQLAVITTEKLLPQGAVQGVVSLSGPLDVVSRAGEEIKAMRKALGCLFTACSEPFERQWSPVANITFCVPMLLFGSLTDRVPVEEQLAMVAAMRAAGCPVTLEVEPEGHAFAYRYRANPLIFAFTKGEGEASLRT